MKILYFDCSSGISGDMILAAFLDAGWDINILRQQIKKLGLKNITLSAKKVRRGELFGTKLEIIYNKKEKSDKLFFRTLPEVIGLIRRSRLEKEVKKISEKIFYNLAQAEAKIHKSRLLHIHFHELSHPDTVIDIVGAVSAIFSLGVDKIYASPLPFNYGCVKSAVGPLPLPAPAVLSLIKNHPIFFSAVNQELITPTGASIITTIGQKKWPQGNYKILKVGYGAGSRIIKQIPNLLRLIIAEKTRVRILR